MSKEDESPYYIRYEDLKHQYGESLFPGSLFLYTDEENEFRKELREFILNEIAPLVPQIEKEANFDLCLEAYRRLGKAGYLSFSFPKSIGGQGKGYVYRTIFGEELAAVNSAVVVTYGASANLFAAPIIHFGTEEQKKQFLKPIMTGELLGAIAITEPTAGSDAIGGMRTTAIKKGDVYVINGEKRFITNGSRADYLLLYALTNPDAPKKHHGISAFIFPTDTPGFERVKDYELAGRRGSVNSHLRFHNCEIPVENLVGGPEMENKGLKIMMYGLDGERCFTCSQYIGIARTAFEIATKYANLRVQFGKKLREFEGISFKISEMYAKLEAGRLLMLRAARMLDAGLNATKEVAAAKFTCAVNQMDIVLDAMQILGGIGYTKEFPLEQLLRDSKISQISAGTVEILKYLCQREIYRELGLK
ncbi:MAG: acyl-CoA dehydrogenase family protein [Candidatus Helarchaeota archaeon]